MYIRNNLKVIRIVGRKGEIINIAYLVLKKYEHFYVINNFE